ncbi:hypothetical protein W97_04971 [Coniosporium apollinis CBS 100218]|uniref:Autophagy-related protein 17 n=1 Tax=Coniosporium apollinis (strain CBS 100218) TaxID=1168221 RepID=R7YUZ5_CONA1|nr:uncharacterized protein W97_04971 [Coniosporium apollinis CBS 100218]EON65732.1 hypothetical protein W97_04971 [Coniosporium apollinis CBS 100218]
MASARASPRSPPNLPSPTSSTDSVHDGEPTLTQLVNHFVAAKRSLSSITHVWRANEIVNAGRGLLERNAVLSAKNSFVRRSIHDQLSALEAVRQGIDVVSGEVQEEFTTLLHALDTTSTHLTTTLDTLSTTRLDPSLHPSKTLHDFIDASSVSHINSSLRACIDRYNASFASLASTADDYTSSLSSIASALAATPSSPEDDGGGSSPLPELFGATETHATEMAEMLQSLVRHYDLCVTALKHTEGGGEAAEQAAQQHMVPGVESLHQDASPPQPLTASERQDMLTVLSRDAAEVEDVVAEIQDRLQEMETQLEHMSGYVEALEAEAAGLSATLRRMREVGREVAGYIAVCAGFAAGWADERREIEGGMGELEGLREFYEGFSGAYDGLIVEVERRRRWRGEMEKVVGEAMERMERMYQGEIEDREIFTAEHGEFLPSDMWPGLVNPPLRYEIQAIDQEDGPIQGIQKETLDAAMKRMSSRP